MHPQRWIGLAQSRAQTTDGRASGVIICDYLKTGATSGLGFLMTKVLEGSDRGQMVRARLNSVVVRI